MFVAVYGILNLFYCSQVPSNSKKLFSGFRMTLFFHLRLFSVPGSLSIRFSCSTFNRSGKRKSSGSGTTAAASRSSRRQRQVSHQFDSLFSPPLSMVSPTITSMHLKKAPSLVRPASLQRVGRSMVKMHDSCVITPGNQSFWVPGKVCLGDVKFIRFFESCRLSKLSQYFQQWASISCRWRYWSRTIACSIFHYSKKVFVKQYKAFFFLDMYCNQMFLEPALNKLNYVGILFLEFHLKTSKLVEKN